MSIPVQPGGSTTSRLISRVLVSRREKMGWMLRVVVLDHQSLSPEAWVDFCMSRFVFFLTVKPDYRRQNVTDAVVDFQMQLAKPAHFGDPSRSTTRRPRIPDVVPPSPGSETANIVYQAISWGLSPFRKLKELWR